MSAATQAIPHSQNTSSETSMNFLQDLRGDSSSSDMDRMIDTDALLKSISTFSNPSSSATHLSVPIPLSNSSFTSGQLEIHSPVSRPCNNMTAQQLEYMAEAQLSDGKNKTFAEPILCDSPTNTAAEVVDKPEVPLPVRKGQVEVVEPIKAAAGVESANSDVIAPAIGQRFPSREAFKAACQAYADSFSLANPDKRFHFATRTSSADKWLVFSCCHHTKGCPVLVRVERDRLTNEWVISTHNYEHKHPAGSSYTPAVSRASAGQAISRPSSANRQPVRKFTVIRKREKEEPIYAEESLTYNPYPRPRSRNTIIVPSRHHSVDGHARTRAIIKHKRSFEVSAIDKQIIGKASEVSAFGSRSDGNSLTYGSSNERRTSLDSSFDMLRPPSPSGSHTSSQTSIGSEVDLYSYRSRNSSISSAGSEMPEFGTTNDLQTYLKAVHHLLEGQTVEALKRAGIPDCETLLSLERAELQAVVDSLPDSEVPALHKMLIKNRVGRALRAERKQSA